MVSRDRSPALNDPAPSYLTRCDEMAFGQLRKFIDDALDRLPDAGPGFPGTEPEFVFLADMLDAKLDAMLEEAYATVPEALPPQPQAPDPPTPPPSKALAAAYARRDNMERDIDRAWSSASSTRKSIGILKAGLKDLEREIERREAAERGRYAEERAAYDRAYRPYEAAMREWRRATAGPRKAEAHVWPRRRIVERIRLNIARAFPGGVAVRSSRFPFLPSGKLPRDQVYGYYRDLQRRNPGIRYDEARIDRMWSLGPSELRQHEASGFDGYTLCRFPYTESVLLECPWVNNAIYVIHGDWERRAGLNKQQLRGDESGEVVVIPHQGDQWFEKVKRELGTPPDVGETPPEFAAS